jgi:hypothetical protein
MDRGPAILGIVGLLVGIIGVLVNLAGLAYQERNPLVSVTCKPLNGWEPTRVECTVYNTGRREARDVYVSFNAMLPLDTVDIIGFN